MRTLGLIGGCGAEATALYYAGINRAVRARRPGHGAKLLLWSFDVEEIDACCRTGDWDQALERFGVAASWLERAGAEALVICTNTMHRIADPLAVRLGIPLLHIADVAAAALAAAGRRKPLLLGTRYLMAETFYRERLKAAGLSVLLPESGDQELVHRLIYDHLMADLVTDETRSALRAIVERGAARGADSVLLACTELGLALVKGEVSVPVFDTAQLHIDAAVTFSLAGDLDALELEAPGSSVRGHFLDYGGDSFEIGGV